MSKISAAEAQSLWGELRKHFANAENVIQEIVEQRPGSHWVTDRSPKRGLGRCRPLTLPSEVRPHVVYQMLARAGSRWTSRRRLRESGGDCRRTCPATPQRSTARITRLSASTIGGDRHRLRTSNQCRPNDAG